MKLDLPRGMRDVELDEFARINYVRERFVETCRLFNFKLMEPSSLELLSTLEAKSGASIANEIYSFKDKGDRHVALRFDLTIGLTRYVATRRDLKMPVKLATFAGVWRYDEPQAGRYRYFHQWDIEIYGPSTQESDAEIIEFVSVFFKKLGLNVRIDVNSRQLIEQYIKTKLGVSNEGITFEMFRAIDKVPKKGAQAVLKEYKDKIGPEKLEALIHLSKVKGSVDEVAASADELKNLEEWHRLTGLMQSLKARKVDNARINLGIVRGLDYYSGIVFEAFDDSSDGIGALVGGGRYDRLTEAFGRKDIGATGVAGGVERIVMALQKHGIVISSAQPLVYVAYTGDDVRSKAFELASALRNGGLAVDYDILGRALRKQFDDASTKGAVITVVVAPNEIAEDQIIVRLMKEGTESKHSVANLQQVLRKMIA